MLFNSDIFLFEFLPVVLVGFFLAKRFAGPRAALIWLVGASIVFYAAGGWQFLPVLAISIATNFVIGRGLARLAAAKRNTRLVLALGVSLNLALLAVFKYADFLLANLGVIGVVSHPLGIALPLGISFYTFTQIAFLIDASRGEAEEYDFTRYTLFVTFFPHLIAGPIIHHKEMMPQFAPQRLSEKKFDLLPQALMLFAIGLAKKVILADAFGALARPVFDAAAATPPDFLTAWGATLSYTFQIYFDFSAYSDMALGLALMFGIRLPVNFLSPYKATGIIEFWRTWHMTLSRFLRDYLYFPLGGNRKGTIRRYVNLLVVMTIGGLWHGAGWTFVLWGALHGTYLLVNHAWRHLALRRSVPELSDWTARVATFVCVALAWVLFRSGNLSTAASIYGGLFCLHGISIPADLLTTFGIHHATSLFSVEIVPRYFGQTQIWQFAAMTALGLGVVWLLPNSMEICGFAPAPRLPQAKKLRFAPAPRFAAATAAMLFLSVCAINSGAVSEFIYYRF